MGTARSVIARAVASPAIRRLAAVLVMSAAGAAGLVQHEGMVKAVYLDPVGIPTACVGHTKTVTHADVGKQLSEEVCLRMLDEDTADAQAAVRRSVTVPITQEQYDALVSFAFNVGGGALHSSTLVRKLNAGDCWGAGAEFPRWNKARGRVLPGLVKRRADERKTFETGCAP
jgi:lysozyme